MDDKQDIALRVEGVCKTFKLPHERQKSLKSLFLNSLKGGGYEMQKALQDVTFDVKKGEFFGIVGRNGSGKSTLLKCIAGVYVPNQGKIQINGTIVPFIELGVGFNPELSGRDNIYLNGSLLGFSRKQMDAMYDDIVEFSELKKFIDQKLKNYSSGMQVRLAFSIAIRARGDILLLDEVLAVGDAAFQQKCFDHFASLKRDKKTIIFVSHSMPMVERFCDRALFLEYGEIRYIGSSSAVAGKYEDVILKEEAAKIALAEKDSDGARQPRMQATIKVFQNRKRARSIEAFIDFEVAVAIRSKVDLPKIRFNMSIINSEGLTIFAFDSEDDIPELDLKKNKDTVLRFELDNILANGTYFVNINVADASDTAQVQLLKERRKASFTVFGSHRNPTSIVHPHFKFIKE